MIKYSFFFFCLIFITLNAKTAEKLFRTKNFLGIISGICEESGTFLEEMRLCIFYNPAARTFYKDNLHDRDMILIASRIKMASKTAALRLIVECKIDLIIFIRLACAIDSSMQVGDIIVTDSLMQENLDTCSFCSQYEIPLIKIKEFPTDSVLNLLVIDASKHFFDPMLLKKSSSSILHEFNIQQPEVRCRWILKEVSSHNADSII